MILENIGEGDAALLCLTNKTDCCRAPYTGAMGGVRGNWFFPNGTRVPSSGEQWDIHRTRGHMVVTLNRRRGGVEGVYRCEIPNAMNVTQTIYIRVYTASTGESDIVHSSCCIAILSCYAGIGFVISGQKHNAGMMQHLEV